MCEPSGDQVRDPWVPRASKSLAAVPPAATRSLGQPVSTGNQRAQGGHKPQSGGRFSAVEVTGMDAEPAAGDFPDIAFLADNRAQFSEDVDGGIGIIADQRVDNLAFSLA